MRNPPLEGVRPGGGTRDRVRRWRVRVVRREGSVGSVGKYMRAPWGKGLLWMSREKANFPDSPELPWVGRRVGTMPSNIHGCKTVLFPREMPQNPGEM